MKMTELEIIFSDKLVLSDVRFNLSRNTTHYIPKTDPSRDGSQWVLDSKRGRYKTKTAKQNDQSASGHGTNTIKQI